MRRWTVLLTALVMAGLSAVIAPVSAGVIDGFLNTNDITIYVDSAKFEASGGSQILPSPDWGGGPGVYDTAAFDFAAPWPDLAVVLYARVSGAPAFYEIDAPGEGREYELQDPGGPGTAHVSFAPSTGVEDLRADVTPGFVLSAPAPNPFATFTQFALHCPETRNLTVTIVSSSGARVRTLAAGTRAAGEHRLTWDGRNDRGEPVAAGLYFCRLVAGNQSAIRKVLLQR